MDNNSKINSSERALENKAKHSDTFKEENMHDVNKKCRDLDEYIFRFNLEKTVSER